MTQPTCIRKLPLVLAALMGMTPAAFAATCTIDGMACTVTHTMTAGTPLNVSNGSADCVQGSSGNDTLTMDTHDNACMSSGTDTVTVTSGSSEALIGAGNGIKTITCNGYCAIFANGLSGKKTVNCNAGVYLEGTDDMLELHIQSNCEYVEIPDAGTGNDSVEIDNCSNLTYLEFDGAGGGDTLDRNSTPGCSTSDYTEVLTSVETILNP